MDCVSQYRFSIEILIGIIFACGLYCLFRKALSNKFHKRTNWKRIVFLAAAFVIIVIFAEYLLSRVFLCFRLESYIRFLKPLRDSLIVLSFTWAAYKFKQNFIRNISKENGQVLSKIFSIALALIASIVILSIFQIDVVPLLAFGGIGAAVLGFAAKDVMSSFFCGLMLSATRSFVVGDMILIPEKQLEGTIEEIGWNVTLVRSKDRCAVYVPNTLFSQLLIVNQSQRTGRRILETFYLRHSDFDKLFLITSGVRDFLHSYAAIDHEAPVLVYMSAQGIYSTDFSIDVYTKARSLADFVAIKEEVLKQISSIILQQGAKFAHAVAVVASQDKSQTS